MGDFLIVNPKVSGLEIQILTGPQKEFPEKILPVRQV